MGKPIPCYSVAERSGAAEAAAEGGEAPSPLAGEGWGEGEPPFAHRCLAALRKSGLAPETLVLQALPVVPPAMRPHVRAADGAALSSDLNELYTRVIARNNALRDLTTGSGDKVPAAYMADARNGLAAAVRALIADSAGALHSLTDLLTEPNGFLKRNLAGKRQDYSGRSAIVSGPELKLTQCGLPYEMALEQFKPFVARKLVDQGGASSVGEAIEKMVAEPHHPDVRRAVKSVAAEKLVLLNRAPTLHRLGIQPFEPVLTDDRAIAVHPLVCYAYNADFDGDQMAAHVPISRAAQAEARALLDSAANLVSPADGSPIAGPVQDIVLGLWWLTAESEESLNPQPSTLNHSDIHPHIPVVLEDPDFSGEARIETTAGRVLLNSRLPRELRFVNYQTGRRELSGLVALCLERCGRSRTREMLDDLNRLGFECATRFAPSYGLGVVPDEAEVEQIRSETLAEEHKLHAELDTGQIDNETFRQRAWQLWSDAHDRAEKSVRESLSASGGALHPLLAMVESGARGSMRNFAVTFGIPGPIWHGTGDGPAFEAPVEHGFWEGMTQLEHFGRAFGARKGLIDTYVRTFAAHTFMRDLIYAGQGIRITAEDCGTGDGLEVMATEWNGRVMQTLARRIRGRVAAEDIRDASCNAIVNAGDLITKEQAEAVEAAGIASARVRSLLTCSLRDGVCARCYGEDLAYGELVAVGTSVGVIAAHAMAEPAIQLTCRTFHGAFQPNTPLPGDEQHPGGLEQMIRLLDGRMPELTPTGLIGRAQSILRFQGVTVDDKHFELIARRMYSFTRIDDPGDTGFLTGEVAPDEALELANARARSEGAREASGRPTMLGALAAARKVSGVIGSAAVGDARSTIALAALEGARDQLDDTLERLVAGLPPQFDQQPAGV